VHHRDEVHPREEEVHHWEEEEEEEVVHPGEHRRPDLDDLSSLPEWHHLAGHL